MNTENFQEMVLEQLQTLTQLQHENKAELGVLKSDVSELRGDVGVLKSDVSELRGDVGVLKSDVNGLKGDVSTLQTGLNNLEKGQAYLQKQLDAVKQQLSRNTEMLYNVATKDDIKALNKRIDFTLDKIQKTEEEVYMLAHES
ncbi:coiled-coil domain-containing protein [Dethiobacter alkaliphilus]|uniref:Uncharacterized protein n=1 Tax=Dethiobacter alkaliphilus AHT 1 TaxID=555088 RepID=C0GBZ8_DETAL|nr:hypothetical protein [Dethiobacter alkaliphilus]EEG78733.1 hypothetical protein DealDRAFT_0007 [Dethiobacter alkaliphilus AHT 1]